MTMNKLNREKKECFGSTCRLPPSILLLAAARVSIEYKGI